MTLSNAIMLAVGESTAPAPGTKSGTGQSLPILGPAIMLGATILVIAIALGFALQYHTKLIELMKPMFSRGNAIPAPTNDAVIASSATSVPVQGPDTTTVGTKVEFTLAPPADDHSSISWSAESGIPMTGYGSPSFQTSFTASGTCIVSVRYKPQGAAEFVGYEHEVTVAAREPSTIGVPFAVRNWGRLVVVLFGTGAVATLIMAGVLESSVGAGILGTLLGVGATSATTSNTDDKQK